MKNQLLQVSVFLLGIAALGRVALSWVEYASKETHRKSEKDSVDLRETLTANLVQRCDASAREEAQSQFEDAFSGPGEGKFLLPIYEAAYQRCLRASGIDK